MYHHVILLRSPSNDQKSDVYHDRLSELGYSPHSIVSLDTELKNLDLLADIISGSGKDEEMKLDACIITSSRSVEAWSAAARLPRFNRDVYLERWKNTAFYVVGAKSASLLEELLSTELRPEGVRILGAGESGTAEKLAEYILRTVGDQTKRFLYLTGDKNRDTLPSKLSQSSSISLETVQVYATCEHPDLSSSIQKIGEELRRDPDLERTGVPNIFIVFFAPSSSSYALPYLKKQFRLPFTDPLPPSGSHPDVEEIYDEEKEERKPRAVPVAIGPTTAAYLREEVGMEVEIVCKKPDAGALVSALEEFRLNR